MQESKIRSGFWGKNRERLCIVVAFGCIPLLLCILYCKACGDSIQNVYLPASWWNDELFYYMQVKGILKEGYPQGYFGYNESHARICSFGVWNPLLFLPWVVWGFFDWSLYAPISCNLVCMTIGFVIFAWFAAPRPWQAAVVAIMLSAFTPLTRFILSSVAETFFMSMILSYAGLLLAYKREQKKGYIYAMLYLASFLTIIRPYYCLLILFLWLNISEKNAKLRCNFICSAVVGLGGYWLMKYWFSAPYLYNSIGGGGMEALRQEGVAAGISALAEQTQEAFSSLFLLLKNALKYGNQGGCLYGVFGLLGITFLLLIWIERKKVHIGQTRLAAGMVLIYTFMMAAIIYMYNIHNGDRHLLTFILLGILFLGMCFPGKISAALKMLLVLTMVFFFFVREGTGYDRMVPFGEEALRQEIRELEEILDQRMELSKELSWDNTVIWLAYDMVDGEFVEEQWQQLYALPAGFGINHCSQDYVMEHFDSIRSRYIAAVPGGDVEKKLEESGAVFLAGNDNISIWDRSGIQ